MSRQHIIEGAKDFLDACARHDAATVEAHGAQDGRQVSPMTWKDGEYVWTIRWPDPHGAAVEEDAEAEAYAALLARARRLDLAALVAAVGARFADRVDANPLYHLAEAWAASPLPDWARPTLSPWQAEAIGRWVALQLARLMGQALAEAAD